MTRPSISEVRQLSDADLSDRVSALRRELFDLRFQKATRQLDKSHRFREVRTKLAHLLTVQSERARSTPAT
jgi:large subunit ribosomal protein L29